MIKDFTKKLEDPIENLKLINSVTDEELDEHVELGMSIKENHPRHLIRALPLNYIVALITTGYMYKDFKIKQGLNKLLEK